MQEIWVRSLDWGDTLEEEMAAHSIILAWRIPRTKELQATVHGVARTGHDLATTPSPSSWGKELDRQGEVTGSCRKREGV